MAYWTDGSGRVELQLSDDEAASGSHSGDCESDVRALMAFPHIAEQVNAWDMEHVRAALKEYGAWDDDELSDDDMSRVRMVWIACGDIRDGNY